MIIEDKELFKETVKDIMIPVAFILGYITIAVLLSMVWLPLLFIMILLGGAIIATLMTYNGRLNDKKIKEDRDRLYRR
jgi:uncharacterized BrkB/YihY/UPF0761 family membrane protein